MKSNNFFSDAERGDPGMFFKEIIEIRGVFEAEAISDLGYGPRAMQQECSGFQDDPVRDIFKRTIFFLFRVGNTDSSSRRITICAKAAILDYQSAAKEDVTSGDQGLWECESAAGL